MPGSPLDPRSEGTNDLIRQGATLCTSAEDVIAALAPVRDGGPQALGEAPRFEPEVEPLWDEWDLFTDASPSPDLSRPTSSSLAEPARPAYAESAEGDVRSRVLVLLGPTPLPIDEVIRMSGLAPRIVLGALTELELDGAAVRLDGSRVALQIR